MRRLLAAALLAFVTGGSARADVVRLQSGETLEGTYRGGSQSSLHLQTDSGLQVLQLVDVRSITFGPIGATRPVEAALPRVERPPPARDPRTVVDLSALSVPAGTRFGVMLNDTLDSTLHTAGHRFECVLQTDIAVGPRLVAPVGARVLGQIARSSHAGTVLGTNSFELVVTHVQIDNALVPVRTSAVAASNSTGVLRGEVGRLPRGENVGQLVGAGASSTGGAWMTTAAGTGSSNRLYLPGGSYLAFALVAPLELPDRWDQLPPGVPTGR